MERWEAKLLALFGCFILPLLCTLLPKKLSSIVASWADTPVNNNTRGSGASRRYKQVLGWLMCFGGGIFFGTYLLHMGPEVRKLLKDSLLEPYNIDYPLPDLLVGLGFLLVLFAEKFVLRWNKRRIKQKSLKRAAAIRRKQDDDNVDTDTAHTKHKTTNNHAEKDNSIKPNSDNSIDSIDSIDQLTITTSFYDNPAVDAASAADDTASNVSIASQTRGGTSQSKTVSFSPVTSDIELKSDEETLERSGEIEGEQQQLSSADTELSNTNNRALTASCDSVSLSLNDEEADYNDNVLLDNNKKQQHLMSQGHVTEGDDDIIVNYINALCGEVRPGVGVERNRSSGRENQGGVKGEMKIKPMDIEIGLTEAHGNHVEDKSKNGSAVYDRVNHHNINDNPHHHHADTHHHHNTRSLILILALSLHRVFEGMSVGLQQSLHNIWSLFLAVMCHETVIGFSLGLQFVKSDLTTRRLLVTSLLCSSIMPAGVAIGMIMTETGGQSVAIEIANGVLQAIAMGTFIYVTFFEILQEELDPEDTSLGKITFVALGFFLMALLDLIPEEQTLEVISSSLNSSTTAGI